MIQQYAMAPKMALGFMQGNEALLAPRINGHTLAVNAGCYLVCVENFTNQTKASRVVHNLQKWYVKFLDLDVFKDIDTISGAEFPQPTAPTLFNERRWKMQGQSFRTTVTRAVHDADNAMTDDRVYVYMRSPLLYNTYNALSKSCPTTAGRKNSTKQRACMDLLISEGWTALPDPPQPDAAAVAELQDLMDQMHITHGDDIFDVTEVSRVELGGYFDATRKEETMGSVVLPTLLRTIQGLQAVVDESLSTYYCILPVNPYAYALVIPNIGGWTVCVQVNMLADTVMSAVPFFSQQGVRPDILSSRLQPPPVNSLSADSRWHKLELYSDRINRLIAAKTREFRRLSNRSVTDDIAAKTFPSNIFIVYLSIRGLTLIKKGIDDTTSILKRHSARINSRLLSAQMLVPTKTSNISADVRLQVILMSGLLEMVKGFVLRRMRTIPRPAIQVPGFALNRKSRFAATLNDALAADCQMPVIDRDISDALILTLANVEPEKWSEHIIRVFQGNNVERDFTKMCMFETPLICPFVPPHMHPQTVEEWRTILWNTTVIDPNCYSYAQAWSAVNGVDRLSLETFAKGVAFVAIARLDDTAGTIARLIAAAGRR